MFENFYISIALIGQHRYERYEITDLLEPEEDETLKKLVSQPYSKSAKRDKLAFLKNNKDKKADLLKNNPFFILI
jgi:hypothetical protein